MLYKYINRGGFKINNIHLKRFTRGILVKRVITLSIIFISISAFTPASAFEIKPQTNGILFNTGAQVQLGIPSPYISKISTSYLNPYVTQFCGISCTIDDYKEAILKTDYPTIKLKIPQQLVTDSNLLTPPATQHIWKSGMTSQQALATFKYSTNQPEEQTDTFFYSTDPGIVHPNSVITNKAWRDCPINTPCLSWFMSWDVAETPPANFTPGTMKPTALYYITKDNGTVYQYIAESPITFGIPPTGTTSTNNNGWRHDFGNFAQNWPQPNSGLTVGDAVILIAAGATYTNNTNGKTEWAFYHQFNDVAPAVTYVRLTTEDTYCDETGSCDNVVTENSPAVPYNPDTEITVPVPTPVSGQEKGSTQVTIQVQNPVTGQWENSSQAYKIYRPDIEFAGEQVKQCAYGDQNCVIALYKATPNGYVQCTVGNTNADCSEWVAGANVINLQNTYQCRINGVVNNLGACEQIQGKYNQAVPEYTNTNTADGALACAPPGFQILNPLVFVQSTGCVLQYLFIPKVSIGEYVNGLQYLLETTVFALPNQFIDDFIYPFANMDLAFDSSPGECLGLGFPLNVKDMTDQPGFEIIQGAGENMMIHPFQACSENSIKLSNYARAFEALVIYLGALFLGLRQITSAFGFNVPFLNKKGGGEKLGI